MQKRTEKFSPPAAFVLFTPQKFNRDLDFKARSDSPVMKILEKA